jgi:flagellar basal-body rod protein FlgB
MDPTRSTPVELSERRLAWLEARQRVLAQNIAHADTPGHKAKDVAPFAAMLRARGAAAGLVRTDAAHLVPAGATAAARVRIDREAAERSRNGNAVTLDEQALRIAATDNAHAFALGLHRRWLGMFRTALGRPS